MLELNSSFPVFIVDKIVAAKSFYIDHFNFNVAFENEWYLHLVSTTGIQVGFMLPGQDTQPGIFQSRFTGSGVIFSVEVANADSAYTSGGGVISASKILTAYTSMLCRQLRSAKITNLAIPTHKQYENLWRPPFRQLLQGQTNLLFIRDRTPMDRHRHSGQGQLTTADINLYAYTHVAHEGGFDLQRYPAVKKWLARIASCPGYIDME